MRMKSVLPSLALLSALVLLCHSCGPSAAAISQRAALEEEMKAAVEEVQRIVNQPVKPLLASDGMDLSTYKPGWFHSGSNKPNYKVVDIRKTQDTSYGKHEYVTSDLNPGIVFHGSEVEFNSMTKYFYADLSVPKKRLTEDEMVEINRLYRVIGRCEEELAKLTG